MAMRPDNRRCTVTVRDLRPLAGLTAAAGRSLREILSELGLPPDLLERDADATLGLADYFRILERLSLEVQDETCRLSSRPLIPGSTHFVWSSVTGAGDLFEAMARVSEAYNMLHGGHYNHVERRDDAVVYLIDDRDFHYTSRDDPDYLYFTMECVLVFLHCMLTMISTDRLLGLLRRVYTRRPRHPGSARHDGQLDFLDVPIRWHAGRYALVYDLEAAFLPVRVSASELPSPNAVYRRIIDLIDAVHAQRPREPTIVERVSECLEGGVRDQAGVAAALGISVATLRRRLEGEGASFRELRARTLNAVARSLLRQGRSVAEVAETLDFADFRSFSRAFKHWNGVTPAGFLGAGKAHAG